jgi:16S rRNA (adenine1518-N6/adenine1519-N6)-dimethyltransferase
LTELTGSRPKKRFSQHFLSDKNIAAAIVERLDLTGEDVVFEIGSGRGTLTQIIASTGARVFSFEIDKDLIDALQEKFESRDNVEIINADFLRVDPARYHKGNFKLIGNIPYDITSPLIDWLTAHRRNIKLAVVTVQRELGDRLCSNPGNKNWAPIAIFTQCFFDVRKVMTIPPTAFYPRPKVFSATLVFFPKERCQIGDWKKFENIVRVSFRHRRKFLVNNLASLEGLEKGGLVGILSRIGIDETARAEQLSIEDYIRLTEEISALNIP